MEHITAALARCAELLTLLDPQVIHAEPMPEDWPETQPGFFWPVLDLEIGDA